MRFSTFSNCIVYQNHTKNLAFATRAPQNFKKYVKNQNFIFFQKYSAIEVWDYSFPEAEDQWGYFQRMTYLGKNSCYTIVMIRVREIASVRLPGNRFRRRHMSPKGIRPGITLSVTPRLSALRAIFEKCQVPTSRDSQYAQECNSTGITLRHRSNADSALRAIINTCNKRWMEYKNLL